MEMWKEIKSLPGYSVSNKGRIRKDSTGQIMVTSKNLGYERITISKHVHRLVAEAFLPKDETGKTWVDHIDGNRSNNNVENLRWVTPSENRMAYGAEPRRMHRMRKVTATHLDGRKIVFNSRTEASEYFHCNDSEIVYGKLYKKGRKEGWTFQKG